MQNERKCGLYIDLLMTVWYSREGWGWVQSNGNLRLSQNDSVLKPKGEFKLAPNPAQLGSGRGGGGARACVVNQA